VQPPMGMLGVSPDPGLALGTEAMAEDSTLDPPTDEDAGVTTCLPASGSGLPPYR
jgi:hypothetical protein